LRSIERSPAVKHRNRKIRELLRRGMSQHLDIIRPRRRAGLAARAEQLPVDVSRRRLRTRPNRHEVPDYRRRIPERRIRPARYPRRKAVVAVARVQEETRRIDMP